MEDKIHAIVVFRYEDDFHLTKCEVLMSSSDKDSLQDWLKKKEKEYTELDRKYFDLHDQLEAQKEGLRDLRREYNNSFFLQDARKKKAIIDSHISRLESLMQSMVMYDYNEGIEPYDFSSSSKSEFNFIEVPYINNMYKGV